MLVGLGINSLSMQAAAIGPVKMMIRSLDTRLLQPLLGRLGDITASSARDALNAFANEHEIAIGRSL